MKIVERQPLSDAYLPREVGAADSRGRRSERGDRGSAPSVSIAA
jgi:hypothetical protein